jgi:hypothetical protein
MSEVISIEQIKKLATTVLPIPGFSPEQKTIRVRVKRPDIMSLLAQGKIPNHLVSVVNDMLTVSNKTKTDEEKAKDVAKLYELYATICLVEPTYEEMKPYITDEQLEAIFSWATAEVAQLENFREDKENGASDNDVQEVQPEAEPDIKHH